MVNLTLGLLVTFGSFLRFIHSEREQEISFAPDTVHNQATLRIMHHGAQIIFRKPLVRLIRFMVDFAVCGSANVSTFEKEVVIALQANCCIWNAFFYCFLSSCVGF